jgi:hypothetical protein
MTQQIGSGMPPTLLDVPPEPLLFTPEQLELPGTPELLVIPPPVAGSNPDVYGNNAYFNNLNLANPATGGGGTVNTSLIPATPGLDLGNAANHWSHLYVDSIIPNPNLAGSANLLTNGGFEIWQRGNGPYNTNVYTADRWFVNINAPDTLSVSRQGAGNGSLASQYCAQLISTGTVGSGLVQQIRGTDLWLQLTTLSLSARVYSTVPNAVRLSLNDGVSGANSAFHTGNGTWQTLTATYTIANTATVVNVQINCFAAGTHYVDNVMLVQGNTPADYMPLHPADDLARCLRYYEILLSPSSYAYSTTGQCLGATQGSGYFAYKALKAGFPAATVRGTASDYALQTATGTTVPMTSLPSGAVLNLTWAAFTGSVASGLVAGNMTLLIAATANAFIAVESNP